MNEISKARLAGCWMGMLFALACAVLGGPGCASDPQLTLQSSRQHQTFSQQFTAAYASRDAEGNTDLVLMDQAAEQTLAGGRADAPVRQIMHIKVLWQPAGDMKADHMSAVNATVHWYVMGNTPASAADIVEYAGTAFVSLDRDGSQIDATIQNASVRSVACRGCLCDPLGPSTLHGTIRAADSSQRVRQALASVRSAVAAAGSAPDKASFHSPKPESPSSLAR
jgi:hypothetical protein